MKVFQSSAQIHAEVNFLKSQKKTVGFVPTMGALHPGHISLIKQALAACDVVVCSIFVNPLQFNNPEDYKKYPSTINLDIELLEEAGCHLLFHPNYEQVYGQSQPKIYPLGFLDQVMEGAFRPDHFQGVANVVLRFFDIVQPDMAFFGLKDYQQFLVVKTMAAKFAPHVQIVGAPTIREENGLAMSSRNMRLTPEQRELSAKVPGLMMEAGRMLAQHPVMEVKKWFEREISLIHGLRLEYFELSDGDTLEPVVNYSAHHHIRAFTAFYAGDVRLIDNIQIKN